MHHITSMILNYKPLPHSRIQSSSSLLTWRQCPRKYYYQYIEGIKPEANIYLIRGKIAHSVLEKFYEIELENASGFVFDLLWNRIEHLFKLEWKENEGELNKLNLGEKKVQEYFQETNQMLYRWFLRFMGKLSALVSKGMAAEDAFMKLKPEREVHILSEKFGVQGYVDALFKDKVMDYKTSSKAEITEEYKIQLGIYCLLHFEKFGEFPKKVGIDYLSNGEITVEGEQQIADLAKNALFELEQVHSSVGSKEIDDYPCRTSPLCSWSNERGSGQCPHFALCKKRGDLM
ncbi:MAG: PD-(D/E)XK nuclease family protein [Candidatus Micrarchaeota archaeon]